MKKYTGKRTGEWFEKNILATGTQGAWPYIIILMRLATAVPQLVREMKSKNRN